MYLLVVGTMYSNARWVAILAVLTTLAATSPVVHAAEARRSFLIPAQPIASALREYADQSGDQVVFYSEIAQGRDAQRVEGTFTRNEALTLLLRDTGLTFSRLNRSTVAINNVAGSNDGAADNGAPGDGVAVPGGKPYRGSSPADERSRDDRDSLLQLDSIIVTGTAAPRQSVLRSSSAVSVFTAADMSEQSPTSTAELLASVPGFWVEDTAGSTQNNVFARGIIQDGGYRYVALMEDGIPLYPVSELSFYNPDQLVRVDDTIERVEVLRGGTAPIFTTGALGGSVNFVTRSPGDDPSGLIKLSVSDYHTRQVDVWGGMPLSENWGAAVGGYYRIADGIRDPGYRADEGGQLRFKLAGSIADTRIEVFAKHIDDRSLFAVPIPLQGSARNPRASDGSDPGTFSLLSTDLARPRLPPSAAEVGLSDSNLTDGIHPEISTLGGKVSGQLSERVAVANLTRFTSGQVHFDALIPGSAPLAGSAFAAAAGVAPNYTVAATGAAYPATSAVQNHGHWALRKAYWALQNDLRVNIDVGRHALAIGAYYANYQMRDRWSLGNDLLMDIANRPNRLLLEGVTDGNAYTRYASLNHEANYRADAYSVYLSDEWAVSKAFRVDAGVRVDAERVNASIAEAEEADLDGNPATRYDNATSRLTGEFSRQRHDFHHFTYSIGYNLELSATQALFGHFTSAAKLPHFDDLRNGIRVKDKVSNVETGYKLSRPFVALSAAAFQTEFNNVPFTDLLADGSTVARRAGTRTRGLELETELIPADWLRIRCNLTVQEPQYRDFVGAAADNTGNTIRRIPKQMAKVTPTVALFHDRARFSMTYSYVGRRFANDENTIELPAFEKLDASLQIDLADGWRLQISADNLTDSPGLTEGNPRTDLGGAATGVYFMARPLFGRSFHASLSMSF